VNPGEVIEANKELMRVTDLSSIWVVGQVYEKDLATIRVGSGANITSDAYPGRVFRGRISYVDPKVDHATRHRTSPYRAGESETNVQDWHVRETWLLPLWALVKDDADGS